jgi:hypothetical protein
MINIHSFKPRRPFRMDTKKYHQELQEKKRETTEKLRQELRNRHVND